MQNEQILSKIITDLKSEQTIDSLKSSILAIVGCLQLLFVQTTTHPEEIDAQIQINLKCNRSKEETTFVTFDQEDGLHTDENLKELLEKMSEIEENIELTKKTVDEFSHRTNIVKMNLEQSIEEIKETFEEFKQTISLNLHKEKILSPSNIECLPFIDSLDWVEPNCIDFLKLFLILNKIETIEPYAHIYSKLSLGKRFSISFKFERIEDFVTFGISDKLYSQVQGFSPQYVDRIGYGSNGGLSEGFSQHIKYCQSFDWEKKVTLQGDIINKKLNWLIDNERVCSHTWENLGKENIEWVIWVFVWGQGDEMKIIDNFNDIGVTMVDLMENIFEWDEDIMREANEILQFDPFEAEI